MSPQHKRNKNKFGQISNEITIIMFIAIIMFLVILILYSDKIKEYQFEKENLAARKITHEFAWNINEIYNSKNSTTKNITVSDNIKNKNYTLEIRENILEITWTNGGYYSYPLVTSDVSLTYTQKNTFTITNSDNKIIIT